MNFTEYSQLFQTILTAEKPEAPYDDEHYFDYVKLNESRQNRWLKKGVLLDETVEILKNIKVPQTWILISEPWCGDASHIVPFIVLMANLNPNISLEIQLRDSAPHLIENYLTNGGKSIPILVVRDESGQDIFRWGPRPVAAQELFLSMKEKNFSFEEQKIALQHWYNEDQGLAIQKELSELLKNH